MYKCIHLIFCSHTEVAFLIWRRLGCLGSQWRRIRLRIWRRPWHSRVTVTLCYGYCYSYSVVLNCCARYFSLQLCPRSVVAARVLLSSSNSPKLDAGCDIAVGMHIYHIITVRSSPASENFSSTRPGLNAAIWFRNNIYAPFHCHPGWRTLFEVYLKCNKSSSGVVLTALQVRKRIETCALFFFTFGWYLPAGLTRIYSSIRRPVTSRASWRGFGTWGWPTLHWIPEDFVQTCPL
jgi:hypothetical protein